MKHDRIRSACDEQLELVKGITRTTIQEIYPHYYPGGAVSFFLSHHNDRNIAEDIQAGCVFILFNEEDAAVGTVTVKGNEICRLFVLPDHQKKGIGRELMDFAEKRISEHYSCCRLDASLPAKAIYVKRGYAEVETHSI